MNSERRNDVGGKLLVMIISALVTVIMIFTIYTARDAMALANGNKIEVSVLRSDFANLKDTLIEIKGDLKDIKRLLK